MKNLGPCLLEMKSEKIKKTVIITGYRCNNLCPFCVDANKRNLIEKTTSEIISEMAEARRRGRTYLEIIGGEQTIRTDIVDIIKFAKKLGFEVITMATNGRMLSYRGFAREIIAAGLNQVIFSIHGHTQKLHDSLTQSEGSFKQLLQGLKNIKELGVTKIGSNTTIVKQNYRSLFEIGNFLYSLKIRNAEFIFVDPTRGGAYDYFNELVPRISEAAPFIRKCLEIGREKQVKHWHIRYVPLCHFLGYESQISELHEQNIFQTEHLAPDFKNFSVEASRRQIGRIKPDKCRMCKKYALCEGIWVEYYKRYGDEELIPIRGPDVV